MGEPRPGAVGGEEAGRSGRARAMLAAALPTIGRLGGYSLPWLRDDVVAGLALTAVLVPVGMGYAEAAGLPAIAGLYASVGPLVAYFLVGPSRILVFGPDSSLAAARRGGGGAARRRRIRSGPIALAGALSIMAGVMCLGAALARLGFLTDLLSRPIRVGYMNGIALTILVSQLPKLLGFSVDGERLVGERSGSSRGSSTGRSVPRRSPSAAARSS